MASDGRIHLEDTSEVLITNSCAALERHYRCLHNVEGLAENASALLAPSPAREYLSASASSDTTVALWQLPEHPDEEVSLRVRPTATLRVIWPYGSLCHLPMLAPPTLAPP